MISSKDPLYPIHYIMSKYILIQIRYCESLLLFIFPISPKIFILYLFLQSHTHLPPSLTLLQTCIISSITIHVCLSVHSSYRFQSKCQSLKDIIMHFSFRALCTICSNILFDLFILQIPPSKKADVCSLSHSLQCVCYNISAI